jgi:hypothetical protein
MARRTAFKLAMVVALVVATGISVLILTNRKLDKHSGNTALLDKAFMLIELADSIRNSVPDTAISYYIQAKTLLEQSVSDTKKKSSSCKFICRIGLCILRKRRI